MTAIASDIITALNNQLELCELKNAEFKSNKLPFNIDGFIENLQGICYEIDALIRRCKYFVYNREEKLNFAYYETLKEKVLLLLEQQHCFKTELEKLGHDTNYKFADFYNDITFDLIDFSNPDKFSKNQQQSDDFNNFVDSVSINSTLQDLPKPEVTKTISLASLTEIEEIHPPHDPNLWNKQCYDLFKYLLDNYYDGKTQRKLINIWFFLKNHTSDEYALLATKEKYINFINTACNIPLNVTTKARDKFKEVELPSMLDHCKNLGRTLR